MKKTTCLLLCGALCGLLSSCGGPTAAETASPTPPTAVATATPSKAPEPTPSPKVVEMAPLSDENAPARAAYTAALKNLIEEGVFPDGQAVSDYYDSDPLDLALNQFAVCDVDGDEREELLLMFTNTYTAGHRGLVFDWDLETDELRKQLEEYPLLSFYESGAVQAGWSHNQGKAGDFWPYTLYRYERDTDSYHDVGSIDAWDEGLEIEGYPSEIDISGTGFVYYINTGGNWTWDDPLDASIYEAWRYPYVRNSARLEIPYLSLTEENIRRLLEPEA